MAGVLAAAFFVQAFAASTKHSLTWDEPSYMSSGVLYLTRGDFRFNSSHPPLAQLMEGAPLLLAGVRDPGRSYEEYDANGNPVAALGQELIFFSGQDPARLALFARLPVVMLGTLLVIAAFGWGRRLYSNRAALVAAALCAFCPNLIAHGGLATEDVACTFFMFLAVWSFYKVAPDPSAARWRDWAVCGLVTGLALSSKYTALLLLPIYGLLAIATWRTSRVSWQHGLRGSLVVAMASLLVISFLYGSPTGVATYLRGIGTIYKDLDNSVPPALLLGSWAQSRWYYYFGALALKISLPALVLIATGVGLLLADPARRRDAAFILVPPAVVLAVTMFDLANFGLRRILPVLPFLYLAAAAVADRVLRSGHRAAMAAVALGLAWTVAETAWIYPNHLSYFSAVAGGPANGYNLLSDSNIDWGQDLPALAEWRREHPSGEPFYLAYFGTALPSRYGISARRPRIEAKEPQPPGIYAISVNLLQALRRESVEFGSGLDWLSNRKPIGRAGYSILIYRIE